jgi:ribosomal protein S27AE
MAKKETCPKCSSSDFVKATDKSNKHYCNACKYVWVPGLENLGRADLLLKKEQEENIGLKREIEKLRAELKVLKESAGSIDEILDL